MNRICKPYILNLKVIRKLICEGKIDEARSELEIKYPNIFKEFPELESLLVYQKFIEIIKKGESLEAISYASQNQAIIKNTKFKKYNINGMIEETSFESVIGLLCYEDLK